MTQKVHPADALGSLKAQIVELESLAEIQRQHLIDMGEGAHEGIVFRATVSIADRTTVAWKKVAMKLDPPRQLITAHSNTESVTTVKVTARNGNDIAA